MKSALMIALLAVAVTTSAQAQALPYKLVITWNQSGIVVVDYPSASRCEQARRAVEDEVQRKVRETLASLPEGSKVIGKPTNGAFCIPG